MSANAGVGVAALPWIDRASPFAESEHASLLPHATGEEMAPTPATFYRAYRGPQAGYRIYAVLAGR